MSIGDIKQELERLRPEDCRHLLAFLLSLEGRADAGLRSELTRKIDDQNAERWISLEEARTRLGDS